MKKSGWRNLRTIFVILAGAITVAACGGGGGSSSDGNIGATYSGNTQAALIDESNAQDIALGAYEGGELQGIGMAPPIDSSSLALAETLSSSLASQDLAQTASVSPVMQPMEGICGGWMTPSISSDASGNFSGSMNYDNYCSDGVTLNGSMTFFGVYDIQANTMSFTLKFNSLTTTMGDESFTSSGSMSMNISMDMENPGPGSYTMNMVVTDPVTGEDCWLKDYTMTVTPELGYELAEISGRYYHYEFGYVDITTVQPIQISDVDGYPQSGQLSFKGAGETPTTLTFSPNGEYEIIASDGSTLTGWLP